MDLLKACLIAFVGWYADIVAQAVVACLESMRWMICMEGENEWAELRN